MSLRTFVTRGRSVVPKAAAVVPPAAASSSLPWKVTDISYRPFDGFWSFNPSIHFDGETWRCVLRCADYALPDSVQIRGPYAQPHQAQTHNAMLILDPDGWKPIEIFPMQELDGAPRLERCASRGFEDMRLFQTSDGVLRGIAASLHLTRETRTRANSTPPPEQVLVDFDDQYNIAAVTPLRGKGWEGKAQKNWVPFNGAAEPRFLYAVERGILMGVDGPINERSAAAFKIAPGLPKASRFAPHGPEVRMSRPVEPIDNLVRSTSPREYSGLRGGTQLQQIGEGHWLGLAHGMTYSDARKKKYYWHVFYLVDDDGTLLAKSPTIKLAPAFGIEFAAGLAIDGDCAVISYGTDDMQCFIAETSLEAIVELLASEPGATTAPAGDAPDLALSPEPAAIHGSGTIFVGPDIVAAAAAPNGVALADAALDNMDAVALRRAYKALRDRPVP